MKLAPICLGLIGMASAVSADACYTVYRQNNVIFQSPSTPVDLSLPLSQSVPAKFGPGTSMVTSIYSDGCRDVNAGSRSTLATGRTSRTRNAARARFATGQESGVSNYLLREATPITGGTDMQR